MSSCLDGRKRPSAVLPPVALRCDGMSVYVLRHVSWRHMAHNWTAKLERLQKIVFKYYFCSGRLRATIAARLIHVLVWGYNDI